MGRISALFAHQFLCHRTLPSKRGHRDARQEPASGRLSTRPGNGMTSSIRDAGHKLPSFGQDVLEIGLRSTPLSLQISINEQLAPPWSAAGELVPVLQTMLLGRGGNLPMPEARYEDSIDGRTCCRARSLPHLYFCSVRTPLRAGLSGLELANLIFERLLNFQANYSFNYGAFWGAKTKRRLGAKMPSDGKAETGAPVFARHRS